MSALDHFSPATSAWFRAVFDEPTPAQTEGWESIVTGAHTLIHAPTGSGKTLAAFLWALDKLQTEPPPEKQRRCRVLYVSPLKALAYDVDRNLRAPLTGVHAEAARLGITTNPLSVAMRTGDTPQSERQAMVRTPPDLLITTPESLYLMLTSRAREILASVETVIVDEIHAVAGTKRGSHLALTLERLDAICETPPQRIGLSATQRPLDTIAEFLGGGTPDGETWTPRPVTVVDTPGTKELDIEIIVPVADMTHPDEDAPETDERPTKSIWPAMYPRLLDLVMSHRSTILFVNSRGLAERLAAELNRLADEEIVQAHHGSVSREQRLNIEDRLKHGDLKAVVATSTLELGIDMAAVDLVVLVESPSSVARGLQRVGRAGHQVGAPSVAKIFPKHRGDLLETAVVVQRMYAGEIESTAVPQNPIDVLAQQLVAMAATENLNVDAAFNLVRSAAPYRALTRRAFESVLDMLAGRYPSDDFAELRPRITWDRTSGTVTARPNARLLAVTNPGTIPDRGLYTVNLPDGGRVGELDEEMVYESRPGDTFVLGSTTWRIDDISKDRVTVTPAPAGSSAKMPFWHGDAPGRPVELGRAVGSFVREIGGLDRDDAVSTLIEKYRLDTYAARNLVSFIADEHDATGVLPSDKTIVVERFRDEIGDWRMVVLSPFGGRVHAPWALSIKHRYRADTGGSVDVIWSDDGIVLRFPDVDTPPETGIVYLDPADVEDTLVAEVADSALFSSRFRESAARSLLLPRRRPGSRTPLWLQRRKAANLQEITKDYGSFPVVLETYREILQDHFDMPSLIGILSDIQRRQTRVVEVDVDGPSPFATSLMFDFIASFMYEYDAPLAERRAAVLALDRSLLAELLGEPEFRELLDADVVDAVEADLQHLSEERKVRSMDGVHDLLNDIGPLSMDGVAERIDDPSAASTWVSELVASRRAYVTNIFEEPTYVAAEDLARLRDTVGVQPPPGVPTDLLEPVADPLGDVVGRYARTHGPFTTDEAAATTRLPAATVLEVLRRLEVDGKVQPGAYRPGGTDQEWVSSEVLKRLRRRSLAVLRQQVEAVEPSSFASFLPGWHGITNDRSLPVLEVVRQLAGVPLAASVLESGVLGSRIDNPGASLDAVLATGEVVWCGIEPVGAKDGRIALYPRDTVASLISDREGEVPDSEEHQAVATYLATSGARFFPEIYAAAGGGNPFDVADVLWDLVWAGVVTNDSLAALRAYSARRPSQPPRARNVVAVPPHAAGRWYLTSTLYSPDVTAEQRALAISGALLERYGIVTRDVVLAEKTVGGFSGLYRALSSLEDVGSVRRGYFIEGMGGAQFALPGAVERIRMAPDSYRITLDSTDPANPYGASLAWPSTEGKPERRAGATVALAAGVPIAWLDKPGRRVATFDSPPDETASAILLLSEERKRSTIAEIDRIDVRDHALAPVLRENGFASGYKGLTVRSTAGTTRR